MVEQLDPAGLLVDVNVRHDPRVDKDFVGSIRDHGVLVPVIAVRGDGGIRVRFGHRRVLAAIEAGLPSVPVLVVADEAEDDAAQVARLVTQYAENQHRTGLSAAEQVGVAEQLAAVGISPAQIARKTRMPRTQVEAALAIAGSDLAKAATMRYELTLDQAAVIADFEDDTDTVTSLVAAAKTGQFAHAAQRARDQRAERGGHKERPGGRRERARTGSARAGRRRKLACPTLRRLGRDESLRHRRRARRDPNGGRADAF